MDGNSPLCKCLIQDAHQPADSPPCDWIPAVHAGMTGFSHLCITTSAGAWEQENKCDTDSVFKTESVFCFNAKPLPVP